jgi:hypothetical protein
VEATPLLVSQCGLREDPTACAAGSCPASVHQAGCTPGAPTGHLTVPVTGHVFGDGHAALLVDTSAAGCTCPPGCQEIIDRIYETCRVGPTLPLIRSSLSDAWVNICGPASSLVIERRDTDYRRLFSAPAAKVPAMWRRPPPWMSTLACTSDFQ